jgi:hypothetical protein
MIRFADHGNFFELDLSMQEHENLPSKGDAYITITLSSHGYAGQNDLWVSFESLCNFCRDIIKLEVTRKGEAILESLSPGELYLQIFSIDSLGHMGVRGNTGFRVFKGTDLFPHSVTFGFEFDPSQLVKAANVQWVRKNGAGPGA